MLIGSLEVDLHIPASGSLKEKRFVLKSLKTRIRNLFNVSVAEVDYHDKWQRSAIGIACVAHEQRFIEETLNKVLHLIEQEDRIIILGQKMEVL